MQPKPPVAPAVMSTSRWEGELASRLSERFGPVIAEFSSYQGQNFIVAAADAVIAILHYLRNEENFEFLVDTTAVDYPGRERRFELVYILYSFSSNERLRVKTHIADGEQPRTAVNVFPTANWLEREVFDMFGIEFAGHPDMRRILLPDEWRGHPLRKDYHILQMDNQWVQENLGIESGQ